MFQAKLVIDFRFEFDYREESGGVDREERDLVDLRAEDRKLRVHGGEGKSAVTGREKKRLVEKERRTRRECDSESESIGSLNPCVGARRVDVIGVSAQRNGSGDGYNHGGVGDEKR